MMYGFGYGNGYEFMRGGMMYMMFIGLIIIAAAIYFVINNNQTHNQNHAVTNFNSGRAIDILNEKFANGEISEDEYSSKKKMINGR
jgi:putative membrane protein